MNVTELSVNESHSFKYVLQVLGVFLYFSTTGQSGTGFGDIYARGVIGRIVVSIQMIASITYGIVIVGIGLSIIIQRQDKQARHQFKHIVREAQIIQEEEEEEKSKQRRSHSNASNNSQAKRNSHSRNSNSQQSHHPLQIELQTNHAQNHDTSDDEKQPLSPPPSKQQNRAAADTATDEKQRNLSLHPLWKSTSISTSSAPSTPRQPLSAPRDQRAKNGSATKSDYGSTDEASERKQVRQQQHR